ncbi:MAG TPA: 2-phosphosulfolactate phosphatase [Pseudonocardiaceae bacterium]|jgi:2-phosphosulfolactate phosphatase|nr:2-phosphosulfolactate phosphatase [Pseudonocardiaceae bacterium]
MASPYAQTAFRARFDWGLVGAKALVGDVAVVAVVDVLSFTTSLTVAVDNGIEVFPFRWKDERAAAFAEARNAVLAVARSTAEPGRISLSPATIRAAGDIARLVLPSPNGSTISHDVAETGVTVIGVSPRNVDAAADWTIRTLADRPDASIAAIAAGERWSDGSLRPAVEDLWGAGSYLAALAERGFGPLSPEAHSAAAAYRAVADDFPARLWASASGQELIAWGYSDDVEVAVEVNASTSVPVLRGESFTAAC